jgi:S1-C subfamily serine protease
LTVFDDGPAHKAGILAGDIILKINNIDIKNVNEAIRIIWNLNITKHYPIRIYRDGIFINLLVKIKKNSHNTYYI